MDGHWNITTFTGALRLTGMTAPMVLDGPMNGKWFAAYAEPPAVKPRLRSHRKCRLEAEVDPPQECVNYFTITGYEPE